MVIDTPRTRLRPWRDADREAFAAMNAHPEVMLDLGGPMSRAESDAKLDRYVATFNRCGVCRLAVESRDGDFLGYAGVMPSREDHPLGPHFDIGWRLTRSAWSRGYATEVARAALHDAFTRVGLKEVLSYTAPDNRRSQRVMERLGMHRDPARDFTMDHDGGGAWHGLVWVTRPVTPN
jgi:RimJ/RimL family protein N-acetyltransferase